MSDPIFSVNVSVVLTDNNKFLMIKRAEDEDVFPGYWGIPGGAVELDDANLEAALERECREEIDVSIKNIESISNNMLARDDKSIIFIVYRAEIDTGVPKPKDGTEKVEWKDIGEARGLKLTPKTLDMLEIVESQNSNQ